MRHLARHAFTGLAALSLLLCVAVCVLWVRSYFASDEWTYSERRDPEGGIDQHVWSAMSARGGIRIGRMSEAITSLTGRRQPAALKPGFAYFSHGSSNYPIVKFHHTFVEQLGFVSRVDVSKSAYRQQSYNFKVVPHWFVALITAVLPAVWAAGWWRKGRGRLRREAGRCPACGYELRASPGRCPECGAAPRAGA